MTSGSLVSAIVVNWNGARHLEISLPTLLSQSYPALEIIVVDNASTDDSAAVARSFRVRWLGLDTNKGLSTALNRGARAAQGEFLLFLNNDMRFHERFVESMVSEILRDSTVFSVDALQYDWDGGRKVHLATSLARERAGEFDHQPVPGLYACQSTPNASAPALMSSAANMLARKSMFRELGGFDERLPLGYEDIELCWRAWVRGWKTIFVPAAICWHRVGASQRLTAGTRISFRGILGGRLLLATKLLPARFVITTCLASLAGLARDLVCLRWQRTRDRVRVFSEYARNLAPLLRERRGIYRSARTSPSEQLERLLRLQPD